MVGQSLYCSASVCQGCMKSGKLQDFTASKGLSEVFQFVNNPYLGVLTASLGCDFYFFYNQHRKYMDVVKKKSLHLICGDFTVAQSAVPRIRAEAVATPFRLQSLDGFKAMEKTILL